MQNPNHTTTEVTSRIDWAKTCISYAKTVWGIATAIAVPILALKLVCAIASHQATVHAAAKEGGFLGFVAGGLLACIFFAHVNREIK